MNIPRIIGVVSGKGGVGKTTTVVNLGTTLAEKFNKDVAMIDCNVTSPHLGLHLDVYNPPLNINSVLKKKGSAEDALYSYTKNLKFMPASVNLSDLDGVKLDNIKKVINKDFEYYDFVLLDSAAGFGKEGMSTIMAADEILFVTNPDVPSVSDIIKGKKIMDMLNKDVTGTVITRRAGKKFEISRREIENLTEIPVLEMIPEDKNVTKSIAAKKPVVLNKPHSKASLGYSRLSAKLLGKDYKLTGMERLKAAFNFF